MMNSLEFTNSNLLTKQCNGIATQQLDLELVLQSQLQCLVVVCLQ